MSKLHKRTFYILALSFGLILNAMVTVPESCLLFSITSQNTARLGVINTGKKTIDVTIKNENGEVLYTKSIKGENNFFQLINLNSAPDGNYIVSLSGDDETNRKHFSVNNSVAKIIKENEIPKPKFLMTGNQTLLVSYFNKNSLSINILFMLNNEVVFEDKGLSEISLRKIYSLKQLPKGDYTVKLYSGPEIFSFPFTLN